MICKFIALLYARFFKSDLKSQRRNYSSKPNQPPLSPKRCGSK